MATSLFSVNSETVLLSVLSFLAAFESGLSYDLYSVVEMRLYHKSYMSGYSDEYNMRTSPFSGSSDLHVVFAAVLTAILLKGVNEYDHEAVIFTDSVAAVESGNIVAGYSFVTQGMMSYYV